MHSIESQLKKNLIYKSGRKESCSLNPSKTSYELNFALYSHLNSTLNNTNFISFLQSLKKNGESYFTLLYSLTN